MNTEQIFGPLSADETDQVIDAIVQWKPVPRVITFSGDLGAGKTTLIKKLVPALGSRDEVNSPTFGLVNEYHGPDRLLICHTDWYRIREVGELLDAGIAEYLDRDRCIMLVEWPDVGAGLLEGEPCLHVKITHQGDKRLYRLSDRLS